MFVVERRLTSQNVALGVINSILTMTENIGQVTWTLVVTNIVPCFIEFFIVCKVLSHIFFSLG